MGNRICRKDCLKGQHASSLANQRYIGSKLKQKKQEPTSNKATTLNQSIVYTVEKPNEQKINQQPDGQDIDGSMSAMNNSVFKKNIQSTSIMYENKGTSEELPIHSKISCQQQAQIQLNSQKITKIIVQQILEIKIIKHILKYPDLQKHFQEKSQNISHHLHFGWRKIKTNLYINHIPGGKIYILKSDQLFKGWTKVNSLIPEFNGKLITMDGCFQGNFVNGQAHGRGSYRTNNLFLYEGDWKNGELSKGKIFYRGLMIYQGYLRDGVPDGYGSMRILNSLVFGNRRKYKQSTYYGQFQKGKFHGKGIYKCAEYNYEGQFKNGKKNGIGILELNRKNYNYHFSSIKEVYQGQFENDFFISRFTL